MNYSSQTTGHLDPDTISAFIDGELSTNEQQGIRQHLNTCHACTLRVLSDARLKAATASAGHRFAPPPDALARLTAQLHSQSRPHPAKIMPSRPILWTVLAATLLLTLSLLTWRQLHPANTLAAELLDQHLATLSPAATPQVISTDRHTVKPWFQGRLPFSFNLPDSSALPPDTTLKGADLTYLNNQPAALLLFTIHKHEVSVFLTQTSTTLTPIPAARAGFNIHTATTPNLRFIAVSDVNSTELDNLLVALTRAQ
jgi:anti-sigma factor RsiW